MTQTETNGGGVAERKMESKEERDNGQQIVKTVNGGKWGGGASGRAISGEDKLGLWPYQQHQQCNGCL